LAVVCGECVTTERSGIQVQSFVLHITNSLL
jgi:hypothetical protein